MFQGYGWTESTTEDEKAIDAINKLRSEFETNRIFFSVHLCDKMELIISDCRKIINGMRMAKIGEKRNEKFTRRGIELSNADLMRPTETWIELDRKVQNELKEARLNLAQEFRTLIGVS